jgi:hypothetical protein
LDGAIGLEESLDIKTGTLSILAAREIDRNPVFTQTRRESRMSSGYLTVMEISGDSDELAARYGESAETMAGVGHDHGLILHAAAKTDNGLMVVNLWPSREESEAAARDQRRVAEMARQDLDTHQISRNHYEVENWQAGPGTVRVGG